MRFHSFSFINKREKFDSEFERFLHYCESFLSAFCRFTYDFSLPSSALSAMNLPDVLSFNSLHNERRHTFSDSLSWHEIFLPCRIIISHQPTRDRRQKRRIFLSDSLKVCPAHVSVCRNQWRRWETGSQFFHFGILAQSSAICFAFIFVSQKLSSSAESSETRFHFSSPLELTAHEREKWFSFIDFVDYHFSSSDDYDHSTEHSISFHLATRQSKYFLCTQPQPELMLNLNWKNFSSHTFSPLIERKALVWGPRDFLRTFYFREEL